MASIIILHHVSVSVGAHPFGPTNVPDGLTTAQLVIDRSPWLDPTQTFNASLDVSLDGGVTWASQTPGKSFDPFPLSFTA